MAEADPATKLRTVLDYVPCEACLSQPVADQGLLCSICRRLDRQVGARVALRTTVILERPSAPAPEPVVIPPAPPAPEPQAPVGPAVEIVSADAPPRPKDAPPAIEVVVEPLVDAPAPVPDPIPPPVPEEPEWDDVASFQPADDLFGRAPGGPEPEPSFRREEAIPEEAPPLEDDYVLNPPPSLKDREYVPEPEEEPPAPPQEDAQWAPPPEEAPEDLEIVETEIVEEEAPAEDAWRSDLWRLPGFDADAEAALAEANVRELSHLSGHDPGELAGRAGLDAQRLAAWVHVADLVQEVGVPLQAALALVAAGVEGPRGLRDADAEDVAARAGGVTAAEVKRWKRRA